MRSIVAIQIDKLAQISQLRFERSLIEQNKAEALLQEKTSKLAELQATARRRAVERQQQQRTRSEHGVSRMVVAKYVEYLDRVIVGHQRAVDAGRAEVSCAETDVAAAKLATMARMRRIKKFEKLKESMNSTEGD